MTIPTEKDFRNAGWTIAALNHPISLAAKAVRCARNGISIEQAPLVWNYATNAYCAAELERAAAQGTIDFCPLQFKGKT